MFKSLRIAIGFLTILPVSPKKIEPADMGKAVALFPFVGTIYAVAVWSCLRLFNCIFSEIIAAWLTVMLITVLNGAIHLDGIIDFTDGLGGHTPEQSRGMMKDSRIGAFGGIGLCFLIIGKIILLGSMINQPLTVLVAIFSLSRWAMAFQMYTQPSVSEGLLKFFLIKRRCLGLITASVITALLCMGAFPVSSLLIGITLLMLSIFDWYVKKKFGGITGDILGATNEIVELVCLLVVNASNLWV